MKSFSWNLLLCALGFSVLAAFYQYAEIGWRAVLFACLTGGAFSALFSVIVTRMQFIHQMLSDSLHDVKATNPLTAAVGHRIEIRKELLTDWGVSQKSSLIVDVLSLVIKECDTGSPHGKAAGYLYSGLKSSAFRAAVQSPFLPEYPHAQTTRSQSSLMWRLSRQFDKIECPRRGRCGRRFAGNG